MEDDGLMVNFSMDATPARTSVKKTTGGRWTDRRKAQLASQNRNKDKAPPIDQGRKRKMQQPSGDRRKMSKKEDGETFVSSLFTSNPEVVSVPVDEGKSEVHDPSNAPLKDSSTFQGLGVSDRIQHHLSEFMKFSAPTAVQRRVIPRLLTREQDLFVQAQTGSGKTLSFALPIFQKLMSVEDLHRNSGLFSLILAPTRELAAQIYAVLEQLSRCCHRIVPGIVTGGEKKKSEKARLRKGVNILVATPGRLADHMENTSTLDFSQVRYVVLDEGDKLMELGFEETITAIFQKIQTTSRVSETSCQFPTLPKRRINVLCSATIKGNVKKLEKITLDNAEMVKTSDKDLDLETAAVPDQLVQQLITVPPKLRLVALAAFLKKVTSTESGSKTMVFFSCSDSVEFHHNIFSKDSSTKTAKTARLINKNVTIYKLHGSLTQQERTTTLAAFTKAPSSEHAILFCTDVAARGLDLPQIETVVEYDPPFAIEDHLHRVGRTARAGRAGTSALFLLPGSEEKYVDKIASFHPSGMSHTPYQQLLEEAFVKEGFQWDSEATTWHLNVERWLLEDSPAHEKAVNGFVSHVRAYATHLSSERECFNVKHLHLGHLAKAFGLRETPKKLGQGRNAPSTKPAPRKEEAKNKMLRMAKMAMKHSAGEFNFI